MEIPVTEHGFPIFRRIGKELVQERQLQFFQRLPRRPMMKPPLRPRPSLQRLRVQARQRLAVLLHIGKRRAVFIVPHDHGQPLAGSFLGYGKPEALAVTVKHSRKDGRVQL